MLDVEYNAAWRMRIGDAKRVNERNIVERVGSWKGGEEGER